MGIIKKPRGLRWAESKRNRLVDKLLSNDRMLTRFEALCEANRIMGLGPLPTPASGNQPVGKSKLRKCCSSAKGDGPHQLECANAPKQSRSKSPSPTVDLEAERILQAARAAREADREGGDS